MQLVIAEKPSVAMSIAKALSVYDKKDGYVEGNGYRITWCVGHLVELVQPQEYDERFQKWSFDTLPIIPDEWKYNVKKDVKKQFNVVKRLMNASDISEVVCATDAGREGELIFRLAYNMAGCRKPILRLWISSMEESAIRDGFHDLRPGREYDNLYYSALARQQADWLVGINGTRLFTVLYRNKVLKVGRVQTPTLAMLVDREGEIMRFRKEPFYTVNIELNGIKAVSEKYKDRSQADILMSKAKDGEAAVKAITREQKSVNPPKLYDLTSLQRDANKIFGFTAKKTLEYTQSLYEKKLVTYPRTDSQFLSDDMEATAKSVIAAIKKNMPFINPFDVDTIPDVKGVLNSKKVTDHHAIIPTMELSKGLPTDISDGETKIYFLIVNRLLCATGDKYIYEQTKVILDVDGDEFTVSAKAIVNNGFRMMDDLFRHHFGLKAQDDEDEGTDDPFDKNALSEKLRKLGEGEVLFITDVGIKEGFTKPPAHYTEATLLSAMERAGAAEMDDDVERKGLGTPATRADIIEKLVKDGFVKREKKQMIPTDDGIRLITVLPDIVKSPKLTADWENALVQVSKGEITMNTFMEGIKKMVNEMVDTYENAAAGNSMENPFEGNSKSLGKCPKCGADVVSGKFGAYCSDKCGMSLSKAMGATLSDDEVRALLEGKKILVKGLKGKSGKIYDAYLQPKGVGEYSYTDKNGSERSGYQFQFDMTFPDRKKKEN